MPFKPRHFIAIAAIIVAAQAAPAAATATKDQPPEICDITGSVANLREINKSPLADGAPTTVGVIREVHVSVVLDERVPHDTSRDRALCLSDTARGKQITYKLCSPTQVRAGDRIRGTEGLMLVDPSGMGCLFDVAVLPKT